MASKDQPKQPLRKRCRLNTNAAPFHCNPTTNLDDLITHCVNKREYSFLHHLKSSHLSSIVDEWTAFQNNPDPKYPYILLSASNLWKRKSALKKSEKIKYLEEQLFGPLLYLLNQFHSIDIRKSLHFMYFLNGKSTSKCRWDGSFWSSSSVRNAKKPKYWSTSCQFVSSTMESVCHFIQKEGGTGVHLRSGYILSCAHVIAADTDNDDGDDCDDEEDGEEMTDRIGRIKYVIFADGSIYQTKCVAVNELDDLALLQMVSINENMNGNEISDCKGIGIAILRETAPKMDCDLFCIGNPSNIDLEGDGNTDFEPKIFHLSFGRLKMMNKGTEDDGLGGYGHSCWTYWGHSGAPIFDENGHLVALHNSWNDETGLRHAVEWHKIKQFIHSHFISIDRII